MGMVLSEKGFCRPPREPSDSPGRDGPRHPVRNARPSFRHYLPHLDEAVPVVGVIQFPGEPRQSVRVARHKNSARLRRSVRNWGGESV